MTDKPLRKRTENLYYYKDDKKILGKKLNMIGDCSGLRGYCTDLIGDLDEIPLNKRKQNPNIVDYA